MVEPTETESPEMLDAFSDALHSIAEEARENPNFCITHPIRSWSTGLDEVKAVRNPVLVDSKES